MANKLEKGVIRGTDPKQVFEFSQEHDYSSAKIDTRKQ